jgi:hypothetical protein
VTESKGTLSSESIVRSAWVTNGRVERWETNGVLLGTVLANTACYNDPEQAFLVSTTGYGVEGGRQETGLKRRR